MDWLADTVIIAGVLIMVGLVRSASRGGGG